MRITRFVVIVALVLLPGAVRAQSTSPPQGGTKPGSPQPPTGKPAPAKPPADQPAADEEVAAFSNMIDFGVRGTSVDGDAARYERYRDLGDGLFLENVRLAREHDGLLLDFAAEHVGRRDQRYVGEVVRPGKLKGSFMWDQIPMLLSGDTRTLYTGIGTGTLPVDDAFQGQSPVVLRDIIVQSPFQFETKTRRHIADGQFDYEATEALTLTTRFRRTDRSGTIPFGGSFGHNSLAELPAPTEHTLSDFQAGAEYVRDPVLLRGGYSGSWFHNDVTSLIFDNPFRLSDVTTGSSRGRLTLPPSNSFIGVNGLASVKLPYRSRATAYASVGMLKDADDPIVPQTINSANSPAAIERSTVEGEARTSSVNLSFVSRPNRNADISVRFRTYDYDNRTPEFALGQRVAYDNAPSAINPPIHTEPYSVTRGTLDADFRWFLNGRTSAGIGYTRAGEDWTHRVYESTTDNVLRLTFDTLGQQWFSIRTKFEHGQKRGEGLDEELLASIGEQPQLRHFDVASRDRDRLTVLGAVTPNSYVSVNASIGVGKDDYVQSVFGLRDNTHRIYGLGADVFANDRVNVGVSYSFEDYDALQRSRQAGSATAAPGDFTNPARNWAADTSENTHSVLLSANVNRIAEKVDLRVSYDFSRARGRYDYITGPVPDRTLPEEVIVPPVLPTPTELPPTLSELNRATLDATYPLTRQLSLGFSYWYERFEVEDFTLDVDANPQLVLSPSQAILMGYLYRPYTANTVWMRLFYRW